MRIAYLDCFSGISGDMMLGALVDAGADLDHVRAQLRRLPVAGFTIRAEKVRKDIVAATQIRVEIEEHHHHRGLAEILRIIASAELGPAVERNASAIFRRLGEAEARVHHVPVEQVHFHEVGAVDAIVDIAGTCVALDLLKVQAVYCSSVNVGSGEVKSSHGILPVPAPATAELLKGAPSYSTRVGRELTTPTGAAIATTLAVGFGPMPPMTVSAIGYGAGRAEMKERPNVLRIFIGESAAQVVTQEETVTVIEANLDDMNPQLYGWFVEQALAAGALDVYSAPVQMKKNRPGQLVTVLCHPYAVDRMVELLFRETTTIGVRFSEMHRRVLERETHSLDTPYGSVRVKVARYNGQVLNVAPEYEDCRRIAAERGIPLKQVLTEVTQYFYKQRGAAG